MAVAYIIARLTITHPEAYEEYKRLAPDIVRRYGGKHLIRGGRMETLEGEAETARVAVMEFPSFERAKAFYASEEYQTVREHRVGSATAEFLLIEGVD